MPSLTIRGKILTDARIAHYIRKGFYGPGPKRLYDEAHAPRACKVRKTKQNKPERSSDVTLANKLLGL